MTKKPVPGEPSDSPGTGVFQGAVRAVQGLDAAGCRQLAAVINDWLAGVVPDEGESKESGESSGLLVRGMAPDAESPDTVSLQFPFARSLQLPGVGRGPGPVGGNVLDCHDDRGPAVGELLRAIERVAATLMREKSREDRSVRSAKMDLARELAYGAGHEINNPLANIAARAQALLKDEPADHRRLRLAEIVDQAFRARDMIGSLMVFAKPSAPVFRQVVVDEVVSRAVETARRASVPSTAGLRAVSVTVCCGTGDSTEGHEPPPHSPAIHAEWDPSQIEEALTCLLLNAVESAKSAVRVDWARHPASPGTCLIEIADDGPGMSRVVRERAFDPFFSGREAGRGLGLGLSKAWRLIQINGGCVDIETVDPGSANGHSNGQSRGGTMVRVELPCLEQRF